MSTETPETKAEQTLDRYECRSCGYIYEPTKGDSQGKIPPGTPLAELPASWRCPVCGARVSQFDNIGVAGTASGFAENLGYGFGVNRMTPGKKNLLIFAALLLGFLFFISLYALN